jgi:hypothetical protein
MVKIALLAVFVAAAHASNQRDRMYYEEKFYNWLSFFKLTPPTGKTAAYMIYYLYLPNAK